MKSFRRARPAALLLAALAAACAHGAPGEERTDSAAQRPPNIVMVFIDDLGYGDIGVTGNTKVPTPNIDALASDGTLFTSFYANSPICSPSRVALTTGTYPVRWRINSFLASREQNARRGIPDWLDPSAPSLPRALREVGYATAHFGKWHMGGGRDVGDAPLVTDYGFDESITSFEGLGDRYLWRGVGENNLNEQSAELGRGRIMWTEKHRTTEHYVDHTIDFMRRNRDRPFYVNVWPNDVHDPFAPRPGLAAKYEGVARNDYERDLFAVLDELDRQLGRLFAEIDRLGLRDETIVLLTGDNGPTDWARYYREGVVPPGSTAGFRGRKWSLYEGGIREPLLVRWPGQVGAGRVDETSVISSIDLVATLAHFAGGRMPELDGENVGAAILGEPGGREAPLFWFYPNDLKPGNPDFVTPALAVRDGRWKLLVERDGTGAELYDLRADPRETTNLATSRPDLAARMTRQALDWIASHPVSAAPAAALHAPAR